MQVESVTLELSTVPELQLQQRDADEFAAASAAGGGGACHFDCFGKGACRAGVCVCHPGYAGSHCEETACPVLCSGNGAFTDGRCSCHEGYKGAECELMHDW